MAAGRAAGPLSIGAERCRFGREIVPIWSGSVRRADMSDFGLEDLWEGQSDEGLDVPASPLEGGGGQDIAAEQASR